MFLNTREQFIIYTVILLISGFLLYRFVVSPELKHVSAAHFHLDSQQTLLKIKAEEAQHHNILNDRVQQLKTAITETKGLLFSRNEAMDFLRLLPQLISQTGSVLITMEPRDMENLSSGGAVVQRPKQEQQVPGLEAEWSCMRMPVRVAIRGKYSEIIRLLEQLEEREQLVVVSEIDIVTAEDCPAEVDSEVMLNLYVYEYQEI